MDRKRYLELAFRDHLSDKRTYRQLSQAEATRMMTDTHQDITQWMKNWEHKLSDAEITFLK